MKFTYIKFGIVSLMFLSKNVVFAQEIDPIVITDYYQQELFINPAVTGKQDRVSATLALKKQWLEVSGSPAVQRLQIHSPFVNNTMGIGLVFHHESYGVTKNYNFGLSYAYHIKLNYGRLSLGLQGRAVTQQENLNDVGLIDPNDPHFARNTSFLWGFNFGTGIYFESDDFYAGLSLPRMFDNTLNQKNNNKLMNKLDLDQAPIYLTAGYVFTAQENIKWRVKPWAVIGYSPDYRWVYNAGITSFYHDKCWIGVNMKYRSEIGANLGVNLLRNINLSYAFTVSYGMPYTYRGLVHEIMLNVTFGSDKKENIKMLYF